MENGEESDPAVGLSPEAVEEVDFAKARRGYEPGAVRARLREAAEEIRRLNTLVGSLSGRIEELESTPAEVLESRRVAEALGDEATRILQSASEAAQERVERAEAEHARIVGEASTTAAATIEDSREQGRSMVLEARNVRERILSDLAAKRRQYQIEVEQLRETRDRLLEALGIFRAGLDGWIDELVSAGPRTAAAAERAGLRVAAQPEPTVAQIEAEIGTARLAGRPLDGGPGEGAHADAGDTAVDDAEHAAPESPGPEDVDEPGLVEIAESPGKSARLYDIEAEPEVAPGLAPDAAVAMSTESSPDAGAIFARLRSITAQPVPTSTEPGRGAPTGTAEAPTEFPDEFDEEHEAAAGGAVPAEPPDPDDLLSAARAVAVGGIARRLKRLVVDEQGDLLDGIRRSGVRAVRSAIAADAKDYTRAARVPMQDFASDIDVSIDDVDLAAAGDAIVAVLVEPVRSRLGDLADETDDADELASAVRSIYRESRSRRADSAAEAAFSAGWPEPIA